MYYDSNEIRTLVQWAASDTQSFTILNNAFEGLYRLDANHEPQPALAESYTVSDDGLVYTFTLREGLQWSNGTPLTASDFVFSWLKQMSADATNGYRLTPSTTSKPRPSSPFSSGHRRAGHFL